MHRLGSLKRLFSALSLSCVSLFSAAAFAAGPVGAQYTNVSLQKHDAGTFYVSGALRGYGELRMLVDTGSSYLVISEQILGGLMAAGNAKYSRELQGVMADGSTRVIPVYKLAALRLGANCWIHDVEAAVFPGATRPILGMNILARLAPFTFSADPPELNVQQCQAPAVETNAEFTAVEAAHREAAAGAAH